MLRHVTLPHCAMQCCAMQHCDAALCCAEPCDAAPCDAAPCDAAPCDAAPCDAAPCDAAPCDAAPCDGCAISRDLSQSPHVCTHVSTRMSVRIALRMCVHLSIHMPTPLLQACRHTCLDTCLTFVSIAVWRLPEWSVEPSFEAKVVEGLDALLSATDYEWAARYMAAMSASSMPLSDPDQDYLAAQTYASARMHAHSLARSLACTHKCIAGSLCRLATSTYMRIRLYTCLCTTHVRTHVCTPHVSVHMSVHYTCLYTCLCATRVCTHVCALHMSAHMPVRHTCLHICQNTVGSSCWMATSATTRLSSRSAL